MSVVADIRALPRPSKLYLLSQHLSAFYFTWPIFILFMRQRFSIAAAAVFLSVSAIVQMVSEVPTGYIADRIGQAKSILLGSVLTSFGFLLFVMGRWDALPLLGGVFVGLGGAFISGATDALLYHNITHKQYEKTMHLQVAAFQSGLILSALTGGFLYKVSPFLPFYAQAAVIFLAALPLLQLKEVYAAEEDDAPTLSEAGRALKHIFTHTPALRVLIAGTLLNVLEYLFINILLESRMIELGIVPSSRGLAIGLTKLAVILVAQLFLMRLLSTVTRKMAISLVVCVTAFPLMGFGDSAGFFLVLYFFFNFATMYSDSALYPMRQVLVSSRLRATELSMYSMVQSATLAAASLVMGAYLSGHGTKNVFLVLGASMLCIGGPLMVAALKHYNQTVKAEAESPA